MKQTGYKIKLLKLLEILRHDSDENHKLSTADILGRLADAGIDCDRRTLYSDIATLNDNGYEVMCERGASNYYYVSDRNFDEAEIRILMDAVQAAGFITEKKTAAFIEKLSALGGYHHAEAVRNNYINFNASKHSNESVFYNVAILEHCIVNRKKASFQYFDINLKKERVLRRGGDSYTVNPVALVYNSDNYYLLAYNVKYGELTHYRIDRMLKAEAADEDVDAGVSLDINVREHTGQVFGMYTGELTETHLKCAADTLSAVMDKFGESVKLTDNGDGTFDFKANIQLSPLFYGWCCSFGDKLVIVSPASAIDGYNRHLENIIGLYKK